MELNIVKENERKIVFTISEVNEAIVNAMRRIMISEVPTMAFDYIYVYKNTSSVPDEVVAHRIGLLPLKANPDEFEFVDETMTRMNTSVFSLEKKAEHREVIVYAEDIEPMTHFKGIKIVNKKVPLLTLKPGEEIELELFVRKGCGETHAKFSPVATAFYKMISENKVKSTVESIEPKKIVKFTVESTLSIEPRKIVNTAFNILKQKLDDLNEKITMVPDMSTSPDRKSSGLSSDGKAKTIKSIDEKKDVFTIKNAPHQWRSKFSGLFDGYSDKVINNVQMNYVASYSVTPKNIADMMSNALVTRLGHTNSFIVDATANVGGNSMSFIRHFDKVVSIELDRNLFQMLQHNVGLVQGKADVTFNHGNSLDWIDAHTFGQQKPDVIFFDPPWGGIKYARNKYMPLFLEDSKGNKKNMATVCNEIKNKTKYIAIKAPFNFDLNGFESDLDEDLKVLDKQKLNKKILFIIVGKKK